LKDLKTIPKMIRHRIFAQLSHQSLKRFSSSVSGSSHPSTKGDKKLALVVGAGDNTGSAIAKAFANEGFTICAVRRNKDKLGPLVEEISRMGREIKGYGVDCRKEDQMQAMIEEIESTIGPIEVAVHNIGANVRFGITETTARVYYKVWEMACFSGFLMGKEVALRMKKRGHGTIIFTGNS